MIKTKSRSLKAPKVRDQDAVKIARRAAPKVRDQDAVKIARRASAPKVRDQNAVKIARRAAPNVRDQDVVEIARRAAPKVPDQDAVKIAQDNNNHYEWSLISHSHEIKDQFSVSIPARAKSRRDLARCDLV